MHPETPTAAPDMVGKFIERRSSWVPTAEELAVLAPIDMLFEGIATRDKALMLAAMLPDGGATLIRDGKILQHTLRAITDRMPPGTARLGERIYDPLVKIDHDIAMVWAPYEFFIDGRLDHFGTNILNLVKVDGSWLIAGVGDNSRRP